MVVLVAAPKTEMQLFNSSIYSKDESSNTISRMCNNSKATTCTTEDKVESIVESLTKFTAVVEADYMSAISMKKSLIMEKKTIIKRWTSMLMK